MKKQKKSYADLAKAIINKYKKRLGDNFERSDKMAEAALQAELDALAERQEMAKQAQAENQYREMCKGGKLPKMDGLSYPTSYLPKKNVGFNSLGVPFPNPLPSEADFEEGSGINWTTPFSNASQPNLALENSLRKEIKRNNKLANSGSKNAPNSPSWWSQIPTESKIGMGAQLAGVLGQGIIAATAGKPKNLEYHDITIPEPELIKNDEQLAAATRSFRGAQNNLRYLSPSQYMTAMSDLATREAAAKAGIIEGTANQNAEILNRSRWQQYAAQRDNAANRLSVDQYNEAMRQNYIGNIGQMVGNVAGVAAGAMKDEGARQMQNSMMQFMNQSNYGSKTIKGRTVATQKLGGLETYVDPTTNQRVWEEFGAPITEQQFMQKVNEHYKRLNP